MTRNKRTTLEKTWETQAGALPGGAEHLAGQGPPSGNTVPSIQRERAGLMGCMHLDAKLTSTARGLCWWTRHSAGLGQNLSPECLGSELPWQISGHHCPLELSGSLPASALHFFRCETDSSNAGPLGSRRHVISSGPRAAHSCCVWPTDKLVAN